MDTGRDFNEERTLSDGTIVRLRHIRPEDGDELRRGFARLSAQSRYRRFFGVEELRDDLVRYLTTVDGWDHVAIVATRPRSDGSEEGLGVARFVRVRDEPGVAEPAIIVADDHQHKGIGHVLADALAQAARERGIACFRGEILADNDDVRIPLQAAGAELHDVGDHRLAFDLSLAL